MVGIDVLVVGGGGREHALALGLSKSNSVNQIHISPGNAGTAFLGINHNVPSSDINGTINLAKKLYVDLVVVGPEAPLVAGLSDKLNQQGIMRGFHVLDQKAFFKWLNDPDNRFFRTKQGRI